MDEFQSIGNCSGSDPFALQVIDDSMEPEFPKGCLIIIDPAGLIENDAYVFAKHKGEYIFRKLRLKDDQFFLVAENTAYDDLEIPSLESIYGRIIQRAGKRRKERKHY